MKKNLSPIKIIFFGTGEFGEKVLRKMCDLRYEPVLIITSKDKPKGRKLTLSPSPVKVFSQNYTLFFKEIEDLKDKNFIEQLKKIKPDLIVVADFGKLIPSEILNIPSHGCLNVHPSLLPKYRGPSPIQFAILNGEKETGVSVILMDEKIDHGPILFQKRTIIGEEETYLQLRDRLAEMGGEILGDVIPDWIRGKIQLHPQNEKEATYTRFLKKEDGKINWKNSANKIFCQIRAFHPWPGTFTFWERKMVRIKNMKKFEEKKLIRLKILKGKISHPSLVKFKPGRTFLKNEKEICVQCGKGILEIKELQVEGKKPTKAEDFLRGHSDFLGSLLK